LINEEFILSVFNHDLELNRQYKNVLKDRREAEIERSKLLTDVLAIAKANEGLERKVVELEMSKQKQSRAFEKRMAAKEEEIERLRKAHSIYIDEMNEQMRSQASNAKETATAYEEEIVSRGRKLEITLSSDIEAREENDMIAKALHAAANDIVNLLGADEPLKHSSGRKLSESPESFRRTLDCHSAPKLLRPIFAIISRLINERSTLLSTEDEEEKLVSKSVKFTHTARKIIKSLTAELSDAADVIYQSDSFVVKLLTFLERNGVAPAHDISKVFTFSEGALEDKFDYSSLLPLRLDLEVTTCST